MKSEDIILSHSSCTFSPVMLVATAIFVIQLMFVRMFFVQERGQFLALDNRWNYSLTQSQQLFKVFAQWYLFRLPLQKDIRFWEVPGVILSTMKTIFNGFTILCIFFSCFQENVPRDVVLYVLSEHRCRNRIVSQKVLDIPSVWICSHFQDG